MDTQTTFQLSFVIKNDPVFTSITRTPVGTGLGFSSKLAVGTGFIWL